MSQKPADEKDRLGEVLRSKERELEVGGHKIIVRKWSLSQSFKLTGCIVDIIASIGKRMGDAEDLMSMLQSDVGPILEEQYPRVRRVIVETLSRTNPFESKEELDTFVEELSLDEAIDILTTIAEQNMRPLGAALGKVAGAIGAARALRGSGQKAPSPSMQSPHSSQQDSTGEQS